MKTASAEDVVREFEALPIEVLGTWRGKGQRSMSFLRGQRWEELTYQVGVGRGLVGRVDRRGFTDRRWWGDTLS